MRSFSVNGFDQAWKMKCEKCNSPANVQFTEVAQGHKHVQWLCSACARKLGLADVRIDSSTDLPQNSGTPIQLSSTPSRPEESSIRCKGCGSSLAEVRHSGKMGCPACYEIFSDYLKPMLLHLQDCEKHLGEQAPAPSEEVLLRRELQDLKRNLEDAVRSEDFEEAARLRDRILESGKRIPEPEEER